MVTIGMGLQTAGGALIHTLHSDSNLATGGMYIMGVQGTAWRGVKVS